MPRHGSAIVEGYVIQHGHHRVAALGKVTFDTPGTVGEKRRAAREVTPIDAVAVLAHEGEDGVVVVHGRLPRGSAVPDQDFPHSRPALPASRMIGRYSANRGAPATEPVVMPASMVRVMPLV